MARAHNAWWQQSAHADGGRILQGKQPNNSIGVTRMPSFLKSMIIARLTFLLALIAFGSPVIAQQAKTKSNTQAPPKALGFELKDISGKNVSLSKYKGKVIVVVNVASKCGMTPQYEQLQQLHKDYGDKGLAIIGIPCNQFRNQEPGSEEEILAFCKKNYGVEFDLMSKVDVNGDNQHPFYKHLNSLDLKPKGAGDVGWNFETFIIGKDGKPVARFTSRIEPTSKEFIAAIKSAIAGSDPAVGYSHKSKKLGKSYYLFKKEVPLKNSDKVQTIYFFAKDPNNPKGTPLTEVPEGKVVSETKSGMLVLKNKK